MRVLAVVCFALLAACAELLPGLDSPAAVDSVAGEALAAMRAPLSEQKAVLTRAKQAVERDGTALARLKLATLVAVLPVPLRDDARAQELLQPLADASTPGIGRFAALLLAQIGERQRIQREVERLAKERERAEREHERLDKERDKREEALRQQLEALRSIERGILEREERLRRRQR